MQNDISRNSRSEKMLALYEHKPIPAKRNQRMKSAAWNDLNKSGISPNSQRALADKDRWSMLLPLLATAATVLFVFWGMFGGKDKPLARESFSPRFADKGTNGLDGWRYVGVMGNIAILEDPQGRQHRVKAGEKFDDIEIVEITTDSLKFRRGDEQNIRTIALKSGKTDGSSKIRTEFVISGKVLDAEGNIPNAAVITGYDKDSKEPVVQTTMDKEGNYELTCKMGLSLGRLECRINSWNRLPHEGDISMDAKIDFLFNRQNWIRVHGSVCGFDGTPIETGYVRAFDAHGDEVILAYINPKSKGNYEIKTLVPITSIIARWQTDNHKYEEMIQNGNWKKGETLVDFRFQEKEYFTLNCKVTLVNFPEGRESFHRKIHLSGPNYAKDVTNRKDDAYTMKIHKSFSVNRITILTPVLAYTLDGAWNKDEDLDIVIDFKKAMAIKGKITDKNGSALPGCNLYVNGNPMWNSGYSDDEGNYELKFIGEITIITVVKYDAKISTLAKKIGSWKEDATVNFENLETDPDKIKTMNPNPPRTRVKNGDGSGIKIADNIKANAGNKDGNKNQDKNGK